MVIVEIMDRLVPVVTVLFTVLAIIVIAVMLWKMFRLSGGWEKTASGQIYQISGNGNSIFMPEPDLSEHDTARLPLGDVQAFIKSKPSLRYCEHTYPIQKDRFTIGRNPKCDITLSDAFVSSVHCTIQYQDRKFILTNSGLNGTWINGTEAQGPTILKNHDLIQILNGKEFEAHFPQTSTSDNSSKWDQVNLMENNRIPRYTIEFQVQENIK